MNRTVISGLRYPLPAAAVCGLWTLSRFIYTVRYGAGDPKKVCFILNVALANKV
jgi:glutathione S-transferase